MTKTTKARKRKEKGSAKLALGLALAVTPAVSALAQQTSYRVLPSDHPPAASAGQSSLSSQASVSPALPADAKTKSAVIRHVRIDGAFPELRGPTAGLIASVEGRRLNLEEAYQFAASVQQAYAAAGYPLAAAAIEPGPFAQGEIRIRIVDGFIENIDLSAVPEDLRGLVRARLAALVGRRHITLAEIQRHVLLVGEIPGVIGATSTKSGAQPGGVILAVKATETPFTTTTTVSNYLPKSYGTYLFSQGFVVNNTLGLGESIHAEASSTDDFGRFFNGRAKTESFGIGGLLPLGTEGFTLGAGYGQSRISPSPLSGEFPAPYPGNEGVSGVLQRASLRANYPIFLSVQQSLRLQAGLDFVDNTVGVGPSPQLNVLGTPLVTAAGTPVTGLFHDQYESLRLAEEWKVNFPWAWGGNAVSALIYNRGLGGLQGTAADPLSRPGASPSFDKLKAEVRITQPLPESFVFSALGRAQTSFHHSLMETEELSLDGPDALSGFGLGTLFVDSGAVGRAELQRPFALPIPGASAIASPYIFGAAGGGRYEQVFVGQDPNVHASSFGGGVRTSGNFTGWAFNETLNFELARVNSNVPFAREGYAATFIYQMKYADDPFAGARPGFLRAPERRTADFSSSGFYAGVNTGYALGNSQIATSGAVIANNVDRFLTGNAASVSAANISGSAPASAGSPIGGGQVGYNYAVNRWVLGAETDIQGAGQASQALSSRTATANEAGGAAEVVTTDFANSKSIDWLGTLRGRVGWTATPDLLGYVTGGLAYGGVEASSRALQSWSGPALGPLSATASSSVAYGRLAETLTGWTLGAGAEWMFAPGLSLKGEYLYYDLGSRSFPTGMLATNLAGVGANTVSSSSSTRFNGQLFRVGLNYQFGVADEAIETRRVLKGPAEITKAEPVWNGVYAGLNTGASWGLNSSASNRAAVGLTSLDGQLTNDGFASNLSTPAAQAIAGKSKAAANGYLGGGQLGYNLQLNRGLVGFEADLDGSGAKGHGDTVSNTVFTNGTPASTSSLMTRVDNGASIDWLGTLRGRLGMFLTPSLLAYGTGGLAYGETSSSTFINQQWSGPSNTTTLLKTSGSLGNADKTAAGWTVGAGVEWMFSRNLSLKAEYLFYDLGTVTYDGSPSYTTFGKSNSALPSTSVHYDGQIARVGLNYHFDGLSAPLFGRD